MKKRKMEKVKILYIVFFMILFLEMLGAVGSLFSNSPQVRDAGATNLFLIVITTIVLIIPWRIEVKYNVDIPDSLEFVILIMIFIGVILGFLNDFYVEVTGFDKLTHTLSGVTLSVIAFQTIVYLNKWEKIPLSLGSGFTAIVSFMFSMTLLVLWEFYEFTIDTIAFWRNSETSRNMQRYQWESTSTTFPQDYGLYDTMIDLWVGAFGALIVVVIAYFLLKRKERKKT